MANYLAANPADADFIARQREHMGFVPIARGGVFVASVNPRGLADIPLPDPFTAEDYVVGQELLGHTFHLVRMEDGRVALMQNVGLIPQPAAWRAYAERLCEAFDQRRHLAAVRDFLVARGDEIMGEALPKVEA